MVKLNGHIDCHAVNWQVGRPKSFVLSLTPLAAGNEISSQRREGKRLARLEHVLLN